ncbi:MAG: hypothetical protein KC940_19200, partial [Candidatus Omnitrophica bacterium]|nr:hypothetical protein [Candidatus Omnitrophota bacterium]
DFAVSFEGDWRLAKEYEVKVTGKGGQGEAVEVAVAGTSPKEESMAASVGFQQPTIEDPYHHANFSIPEAAVVSATVTKVMVDGEEHRNYRVFQSGYRETDKGREQVREEDYKLRIEPGLAAQILVACNWTNSSDHTVEVFLQTQEGEKSFKATGKAPGKGGYWNADWPYFISLTLHETVGMIRQGEPVIATIGVFADTITDPAKELRVVAYDPTHPEAGEDGYIVAPCQVISATTWNDKEVMALKDVDGETGEPIHRYDPTTTIELVFAADVLPYEEKVYQVLYGNPNAGAMDYETDIKVTPGDNLGQTVAAADYEIGLATNSGAVETVILQGEGDPVLLEHKLETNGAVHWNPGCYAPPTPWVHASDWENPELEEITGPVMHRRRVYAPLPHMTDVAANVSYEFFSGQPYIVQESLTEVMKDIFVKALRNGEIVFNHAVLNEFVWKDSLGVVESLEIEGSREHPIHALEIPPNVEWMAFINREKKVGFASIILDYLNTNQYGDLPSEAQPYFYVQNGPWIYWSRPIVYPFGTNNLTRMMLVRKGSLYYEKNAWVPFRLGDEDPFQAIEETQKRLRHPLLVHEWMGTDNRTPRDWIMPLLTMPFNEGVAGAAGSQKGGEK